MYQEAALEEWRNLYEAAEKIKEKKPWDQFWDMDLIGIQEGKEEDTVFFSILGKGGSCYGISMYQGYSGLNDFMLLTMQEELNVSTEYAMFSQNTLTCYWGNREELSSRQRQIIKELGYKYRGKNQWLYFMSYSKGYYPYNLDREETERLTKYLRLLAEALDYYQEHEMNVEFESGHMFLYAYDKENGKWQGSSQPLPFTMYSFPNLMLEDDELRSELRRAEKNKMILEADIAYMGVGMKGEKGDRPKNPEMVMIADSQTGMILRAEMTEQGEDEKISLAQEIVDFILNCGAPKEIRISNLIIEAVLEDICAEAGIHLRRVKRLKELDEFWQALRERGL